MTQGKVLVAENSSLVTIESKAKEKAGDGSGTFPQVMAASLATLSALCMGMCLSWSSSAIPMLLKQKNALQVNEEEAAWIRSLITLGGCFGAIPTGMVTSKIGPKRTLQLLALPMLISWILIAFSPNVYYLYGARILVGVAVGATTVAAPMYVADLAHKSIRGALGTFFQVQVTIGLLLEYILGSAIEDFQCLALSSAILPIVFLISFSLMPESPVHLYSQQRVAEARAALEYFRGGAAYAHTDPELAKIGADIRAASLNRASIGDLFESRATIRALVIGLGLMAFQQLSGINAVLFYAADIFADTGSSMSPNASAVLVGAVQVIATLLSTVLVDRAGRKLLLFISSSVMCVCLIALGAYFHLRHSLHLEHLNKLPLACLAVYIVVFSLGFGPIPWMMMGEIFTPKTKGLASSVSAAANWLLAFIVTNQFPSMVRGLGKGATFGVFGVICGVAALFVVVLVPETKGRDVEQVQSVLMGRRRRKCDAQCDKTTAV